MRNICNFNLAPRIYFHYLSIQHHLSLTMSQKSSHLGIESVTTGQPHHQLNIKRFEGTTYDEEQCFAAIRGEKIPDQLGNVVIHAAVVRGIRLYYTFATSEAVTSLCTETASRIPQFTRARNARLIMSNMIPDGMDTPETQPYCIWYPDLAKEDTYREVARVYPAMRYHVGRACAAAGYAKLYAKLDLLPDVSTLGIVRPIFYLLSFERA